MVDKEEEDTMVVFYSDHTPALNVFLKDDFYLDKYETPYAVYANFDIPKEKLNLESYQLSTLAMGLSEVEYGPIETIHAMRGNNENYQKEVKNINSKRNKNSLKKQENLQLRYLREFSFIHKDVVYRVCDV